MGKRSDFERIEKDFYRSIDPRIGNSIVPHIKKGSKYYEPCYGIGDLVLQLEKDLICTGYSDIQMGLDALELSENELKDSELIITNPPWNRKILHPMIDHFVSLRDTWLLFDSDWSHTKQSARFMKDYCTDIISVGRLIWIPETKVSGKDNCSWYKFSRDKKETTKFHGR